MKLAKGPRPWSIHAFAAAFLVVALIGLTVAISDPVLTYFLWMKRVPSVEWTPDLALITSFSMFTIALIPIVWIYVLQVARARWFVLAFGTLKIALWAQGFEAVTYSVMGEAIRVLEPVLIVVALVLLFSPASLAWLRCKAKGQNNHVE